MRIWNEEVFGPVMCIEKFGTDEEAVGLVNSNPFGLGSSIFSGSKARAKAIAIQLKTGASSINDFATTYLCQSLPFGGVKESGYDKFGGVEGLRGMCYTKAVCEDAFVSYIAFVLFSFICFCSVRTDTLSFPWNQSMQLMKTTVPPELQYPVKECSFAMVGGIIKLFFSLGIYGSLLGIVSILKALLSNLTSNKKKD